MTKQEYLNMFSTEKGRGEIVRVLTNLEKHKGWSILMIYFQDMLDSQEMVLHDIERSIDDKELQKIRTRLYYIKEIMGMPKTLAREVLDSKEVPIPEEIYN